MTTESSKKTPKKQFAFTGEWIPELDPMIIGEENFSKLENCRYTDVGPEGVLGYTKINSSVIQTTYFKGRSGIQLLSPYSGQNRVLVQAENTGLTASSVFENKATVPATGNFEATDVHQDDASAALGRFYKWPGGHIAYCNSEESRIWAGDELRVAGFINYSPTGASKFNFTEAVQNLEDDAYNIATLHRVAESIDTNTIALYHMENANDATTNAHNLTNNNVTFIAAGVKFGTLGASFNGTNAELHVALPDAHPTHFILSNRSFTIDSWVKLTSLPTGGSVSPIFFQSTSTSVFEGLWVESDGSLKFSSRTGAGSVEQMCGASGFSTPAGSIAVNTWHHVEFVQSADDFYMFIDGILKGYTTGTTTLGDQTGDLYIGFANTLFHPNKYLFGYIDEWRFSNVARHTGAFEVPSSAYGSSTYATYIYVGSLRPLSGIKFYVKTANTTAGTMTIDYWDGSSWSAVSSLSDGTAVGGKPLAQTGTATFTSTISSAKVKIIDTMSLYWYRVKVTDCDATTSIYHVSVKAPWQSVKDLWDGIYRTAVKVMVYNSPSWTDWTTNVAEEDYDSTNTATYANLGVMTYTTNYIVVGFEEPVTAIRLGLVGTFNLNAGIVLGVQYWNGEKWTSVGTIEDGTINNNTTLSKPGVISWNPPAFNSEFKTTIEGSGIPLYYYKIYPTNGSPTPSILIDIVSGVSAQRNMGYGYVFPFTFASRPMLCGKVSSKEGNRVDYGGANTTEVWNGDDSSFGPAGPLYFGSSTNLTAACEIYNRFGAAIYDLAVFTKQNETYLLNGTDSESWKIYQISSEIGCPAPMTMDTAEVAFGVAADATRNIALWLSASGPVVFDGSVLVPIDTRIGNYFDETADECINYDAIANAVGWCDPNYHEYNLCIPSGTGQTTNNIWLVLDLLKKRWFRKVPGSAGCPQGAFKVQDTYGNKYVYGLFDDGYMRRLEYGATWDGQRIEQVIGTAEFLPSGSSWDITNINRIRMIFERIDEAVGVSIFYGQNGATVLESLTEFDPTQGPDGDKNRTVRESEKIRRQTRAWTHRFEFQCGTSATEKGLRFLGWSFDFDVVRDDD